MKATKNTVSLDVCTATQFNSAIFFNNILLLDLHYRYFLSSCVTSPIPDYAPNILGLSYARNI